MVECKTPKGCTGLAFKDTGIYVNSLAAANEIIRILRLDGCGKNFFIRRTM